MHAQLGDEAEKGLNVLLLLGIESVGLVFKLDNPEPSKGLFIYCNLVNIERKRLKYYLLHIDNLLSYKLTVPCIPDNLFHMYGYHIFIFRANV